MLRRFVSYGAAGWIAEVCFTGVGAALQRDRATPARTYLWMHPIYGGGGLALEALGRRSRGLPRLLRGALNAIAIVAIEYATGALLRRTLGACPWDYSRARRHLHGLVRWDYLPFWFALGLAFEPVSAAVVAADRLLRPRRRRVLRLLSRL